FRVTVPVTPRPMLLVSNEDGVGRIKARRADILTAWPDAQPAPGLFHILARPALSLFDAAAVRQLRGLCRGEGICFITLDTFETLIKNASGPPEEWQRRATHTVADFAAATGALIWVLDHTRKRPGDAGPLSLDDIIGATAKAAVADAFLVMGR